MIPFTPSNDSYRIPFCSNRIGRFRVERDGTVGIETCPDVGANLVLHCRQCLYSRHEFQPHAQLRRLLPGFLNHSPPFQRKIGNYVGFL